MGRPASGAAVTLYTGASTSPPPFFTRRAACMNRLGPDGVGPGRERGPQPEGSAGASSKPGFPIWTFSAAVTGERFSFGHDDAKSASCGPWFGSLGTEG
jgi:hypothetical protein